MGSSLIVPSVQAYKLIQSGSTSTPAPSWIPFSVNLSITKKYAFRLTGLVESATPIFLFLNGDTTATNYISQNTRFDSTTISTTRSNDSRLTQGVGSSEQVSIHGYIDFGSDGICRITLNSNYSAPSTTKFGLAAWVKISAVASITEIKFEGSGGSNLFTNAKFSLYEVLS